MTKKFKPIESLPNKISVNFVTNELLKRQNLTIITDEAITLKKYNEREIDNVIKRLSTKILYAKAKKGVFNIFPIYIFLDLQYSITDNKHASIIIITYEGDNMYYISFFDPNGPLNDLMINGYNFSIVYSNINSIITKLSDSIKNYHIENTGHNADIYYHDFMSSSYPINIMKHGQCDSLCLWVMYLTSGMNTTNDIAEIINELKNTIMQIYNGANNKKNLNNFIKVINNEIFRFSK